VFDHDFEDLKRGVSTHAPEESWRGGCLGSGPHLVESVPISPEGLNQPVSGCASQQLGAHKAVWYRGREETTETSQQLSLYATSCLRRRGQEAPLTPGGDASIAASAHTRNSHWSRSSLTDESRLFGQLALGWRARLRVVCGLR
jgi:hypothetical protein